MIALDTNILVYAHREDSPHHTAALRVIQELTDAPGVFGIPWPCVSEFLAVTTHPRIYDPPSLLDVALDAIEQLTSLPKALLLGETSDYLRTLRGFGGPGMSGARLHEARIAAICLGHGVTELLTADRDYSPFPSLKTRNPLTQT